MVKELSWSELQEEMKEGALFVDFWAEWCGPCKRLAPVYEEVSKELGDKAKFAKVNIEQNPDAASLGISSIPCIILFKDGAEKDRLVGALPEDQLKERLTQMLG